MQVRPITSGEELAALRHAWNRLAPNPFCSWDWLECWWRHYHGAQACNSRPGELSTLAVYDAFGSLAAVAPWYMQRSLRRGRVVRWLGSGEVCSDHLTIPCRRGAEDLVAETLAEWLVSRQSSSSSDPCGWDLLELDAVDARDSVIARLVHCLDEQGCPCHVRNAGNCWSVDLPASWDEYLAKLSRSHRKQLRQLQRRLFDPGQAALRTVQSAADLATAWPVLLALHEKRWRGRSQLGCFHSPSFRQFLHEVTGRLLQAGQLQFHWLELEGRPVAADYHLSQAGAVYVYQGGMDPDVLRHEPGRLITMAALRRAIGNGSRNFDFLRGDEPYKAHWRAVPQPLLRLRITSRRLWAQLRHGAHAAAEKAKDLVKMAIKE